MILLGSIMVGDDMTANRRRACLDHGLSERGAVERVRGGCMDGESEGRVDGNSGLRLMSVGWDGFRLFLSLGPVSFRLATDDDIQLQRPSASAANHLARCYAESTTIARGTP